MEAKKDVTFKIKPSVPPKVWNVVESVRKNEEDKLVKFVIQEIPEDRYDDVLQHMTTYFMNDEPVCSSVDGKNDPLFVEDFCTIWLEILKQGISVGAFVEDPNGGKAAIAGVNVLGVDFRDHETNFDDTKMKSPKSKSVMSVILRLSKGAHIYERYNVDRYMYAFGLSVDPRYRGQALGAHILRARENIGREFKIPVTSTAFTSPISQKLAERVGFESVLEQDYEQILNDEGKPAFPGIKVKTFKIMARRLY